MSEPTTFTTCPMCGETLPGGPQIQLLPLRSFWECQNCRYVWDSRVAEAQARADSLAKEMRWILR